MPAVLPDSHWQWQANLDLVLTRTPRGTLLSRCRHHGPLYVQKPFYPEGKDCAHLYLLHPPGGLVSGDELTVQASIGEDAHSLITTPGAARAYQARQQYPVQKQKVILSLERNASLEWFPMETIVYNGAAVELETTVQLKQGSQYLAWEISCFGLPASGQAFESGYFLQNYRIEQEGIPLFIDRLYYQPQESQWFHSRAGAQGFHVSGFFITGPLDSLADDTLDSFRQLFTEKEIAITFVNGFIIARYLGHSAFQGRKHFIALWEKLRPHLLQRQASAPGIWNT